MLYKLQISLVVTFLLFFFPRITPLLFLHLPPTGLIQGCNRVLISPHSRLTIEEMESGEGKEERNCSLCHSLGVERRELDCSKLLGFFCSLLFFPDVKLLRSGGKNSTCFLIGCSSPMRQGKGKRGRGGGEGGEFPQVVLKLLFSNLAYFSEMLFPKSVTRNSLSTTHF